ncbi:hypothetical protein [Streptomyces sp. NPDC018059]|uniref:hypothetical protein n=1 Tax=Streptomyces sp. NPDC018059 TaxID=3365041 RepID=UPI0037B5D8F1
MPRFLLYLSLGSLASCITYAITADAERTVANGICVAFLVWFGLFLLDEVL